MVQSTSSSVWLQAPQEYVARKKVGIKDLETTLHIDAGSALVGSAPTGFKDLETTLHIAARSAHRWQGSDWSQGLGNNA